MTSVHLIHAGYTGEHVGSTVVLVRDGDATIVVDPGMVARRSLILDPLAALGVVPEAVTHVFLSHHHPDHTINCALFPERRGRRLLGALSRRPVARPRRRRLPALAEEPALADARATARRTRRWSSRPTTACTSMTHLWWHTDRTPALDPFASDQAALERGRARVLAAADVVIPGHGAPFRVRGRADAPPIPVAIGSAAGGRRSRSPRRVTR